MCFAALCTAVPSKYIGFVNRRSGVQSSQPHQRNPLWHMPNSDGEIKELRDQFKIKNLRSPHPREDDAPEEPPWAWRGARTEFPQFALTSPCDPRF
jgi:hypothetical protein